MSGLLSEEELRRNIAETFGIPEYSGIVELKADYPGVCRINHPGTNAPFFFKRSDQLSTGFYFLHSSQANSSHTHTFENVKSRLYPTGTRSAVVTINRGLALTLATPFCERYDPKLDPEDEMGNKIRAYRRRYYPDRKEEDALADLKIAGNWGFFEGSPHFFDIHLPYHFPTCEWTYRNFLSPWLERGLPAR